MRRLLVLLLTACSASAPVTAPTPAPAPPQPTALPTADLHDPQQSVRDAAAAVLRAAYAHDPSRGDRGEAYWRAQIAAVKPGISEDAFVAALHGSDEGGGASGQSATRMVRLDDFWVAEAFFDFEGHAIDALHYRANGRLIREVRDVWVDPPKALSGPWTTYFATGVVSHDIVYDHGVYARFRTFYDNGQLVFDQHYIDGKNDGDEIEYHRDGSRAVEGHYAAGKQVGHWVIWFENGKVETDQTYVDGKLEGLATTFREDGEKVTSRYHDGVETGQAGWDAHGALEYAHGTMKTQP